MHKERTVGDATASATRPVCHVILPCEGLGGRALAPSGSLAKGALQLSTVRSFRTHEALSASSWSSDITHISDAVRRNHVASRQKHTTGSHTVPSFKKEYERIKRMKEGKMDPHVKKVSSHVKKGK